MCCTLLKAGTVQTNKARGGGYNRQMKGPANVVRKAGMEAVRQTNTSTSKHTSQQAPQIRSCHQARVSVQQQQHSNFCVCTQCCCTTQRVHVAHEASHPQAACHAARCNAANKHSCSPTHSIKHCQQPSIVATFHVLPTNSLHCARSLLQASVHTAVHATMIYRAAEDESMPTTRLG